MLTIIHGDDITKSRNYFIELKSKLPDAQTLNGQDMDLTKLAQIFEGGNLFSEEKNILIENFFLKKNSISGFRAIENYLLDHSEKAKIVFWESKEIEKKNIPTIKDADIKLFKLPQSLFIFLDSIKPDNGLNSIRLFRQTLQTTDTEVVFYLIVKHFRLLLAIHPHSTIIPAKAGTHNNIKSQIKLEKTEGMSELIRLQSWQKMKLKKQSSYFTFAQLVVTYKKLYEVESNHKTGNLPVRLTSAIDILLLGI